MSKLAQAINAVQTKNKQYKMPSAFDITEHANYHNEPFSVEYLKEYIVEAKFGLRMYLDQGIDDTMYNLKLQECRQHIVEAVFGEFRADFIEMYKALADRNVGEAQVALQNFYNKMFKVEEK